MKEVDVATLTALVTAGLVGACVHKFQQEDDLMDAFFNANVSSPTFWLVTVLACIRIPWYMFMWKYPHAVEHMAALLGMGPADLMARTGMVSVAFAGIGLFYHFMIPFLLSGSEIYSNRYLLYRATGIWCYFVGQSLVLAVYKSLGTLGVYYSSLWPDRYERIPWVYGFPYNIGIQHPMYVGTIVEVFGLALGFISRATIQAGLVQCAMPMILISLFQIEWESKDRAPNASASKDVKSNEKEE